MHLSEIRKKLKQYITLTNRLWNDPRIPTVSKALIAIAVGYFFLPFDLIPDFIPVLGQLDDVVVIPGLIALALYFIPKDVLEEHRHAVFGG